jgi:TolA-binding protein
VEDLQFQEPSDRERMLAGDTVLPPPGEVRAPREQKKKEGAEESTLKLMAELCRRQDEYEQVQVLMRDEMARLEKERLAAAQTQPEETAKRFSELEQRLQNIEQQIAALAQLINQTGQRTPPPETPPPGPETPFDPTQQPVIPLPEPKKTQLSSKDPTVPALPEPGIYKLPPDVNVTEAGKEQPTPIPETAPRTIRQPRTFTPDAQALRIKAKRAFQWIITEYPNTDALIEARLNLAQMALEDADVQEALKQYESLIAERPEDQRTLEAALEAGRLRSDLSDFAVARKHLYACADRAPESRLAPLALLEAARTFDYEAAYGQALTGYADVQHRFENTAAGRDARRFRADLLLRLGRPAEARNLYAEIGTDDDPSNTNRTHAWLQTARSFMQEKRFHDASNTLREFLMEHLSDEDGGDALRLYAKVNSELGEGLDAARALARIAEKYPTYSKVLEAQELAGEEFLALELASAAAEQFQKALKALEAAAPVQRANLEPPALLGLARAQRLGGKPDDALATLRQLRTRFPGHTLAQAADLEQAELMVAAKRYGDAAELLGSSAQAYPGAMLSSRALIRKAELEERVVSPEQAVQTYLKLKAAELEPAAAANLAFRRAICLIHLSREPEALVVLRELARNDETPPPLVSLSRFQIALALERQGKFNDALVAYLDFADKSASVAETNPELQELIKTARWKAEKLQWLRGLGTTASHTDIRTEKL